MESSSPIRSIKDSQGPLGRNATERTRAEGPFPVRVHYCGDDEEEEEAEVAFAVLVEQGKEVAAEASRASSSI